MPFVTFVALFFLGVTVIAFIGARKLTASGPAAYWRRGKVWKRVGWGGVAAFLFFGFFSCATFVPANEYGIITVFGRWSHGETSGFHLTAPWASMESTPTRNQKSIRDQADGNDACIPVKLLGGASACVDATVLYTIDEKNAETLWRGWGGFSRLNQDLINRSTDDATATVYGNYSADKANGGEVRAEITTKITTLLKAKLANSGVELGSITLGDIHLPADVQNRINTVLEQDAKVLIAQKKEQENQALARANAALQGSLSHEALVKYCLDAMKEIKPTVPPACGLGDTSARPSVMIPAK